MRTQAGCLYESFSADDGTTWTPAAPSRFPTSNSPANLLRHVDGRLVLTWNHCELLPRHAGESVYGGRDALHIAISDDDGRTWRGFHEIYLDHRRNDNPAARGDRGTAYPLAQWSVYRHTGPATRWYRGRAAGPDPHGTLVRRVAVTITDPVAPAVTPDERPPGTVSISKPPSAGRALPDRQSGRPFTMAIASHGLLVSGLPPILASVAPHGSFS